MIVGPRSCLPAIAIAVTMSSPKAESAPQAISPEMAECFDWFDRVGFEEITRKPFGLVTLFAEETGDGGKPARAALDGFLIEDDAHSLTILTTDLLRLRVQRFPETPAVVRPSLLGGDQWPLRYARAEFQPADLGVGAKAFLKTYREARQKLEWRVRFAQNLSAEVRLFVIARACAARGQSGLAVDYFSAAESAHAEHRKSGSPATLRELLDRDLGNAMLRQAIDACEDPALSRGELAARFAAVVRHFPKHPYAALAAQYLGQFSRLVAEEKAEPMPADEALADLNVDAQVRGWIRRLRDDDCRPDNRVSLNAMQVQFAFKQEHSAGTRLVRLGPSAVAALIETLGDASPVRSIVMNRELSYPYAVLTLGDYAYAILERIAGRKFATPGKDWNVPSIDGDLPAKRTLVEAWWRDAQLRGFRELLIEGVARGDESSAEQARRLIADYPDAAPDALRRGLAAVPNLRLRTNLLYAMVQKPEARLTDVLLHELRFGPSLYSRCIAAEGLHRLKHPAALEAMLAAWDKARRTHSTFELMSISRFLAASDSAEALGFLAGNLERCPVTVRNQVLHELARGQAFDREKPYLSVSSGSEKEAQGLLTSLLLDIEYFAPEKFRMLSPGWRGPAWRPARLCDVAAATLASRWPLQFSFDASAPLRVRDAQRTNCLNVWRTLTRQLPLEVPRFAHEPASPKAANRIVFSRLSAAKGASVPKSTSVRVGELSKRSLTGKAVIELVREWMREFRGFGSIQIAANREGDGTGITLDVWVHTASSGSPGGPWKVGFAVFTPAGPLEKGQLPQDASEAIEDSEWLQMERTLDASLTRAAQTPLLLILTTHNQLER